MGMPIRTRGPHQTMVLTANERFKKRWGSRVAWSVIAAVAAHVAAFALWPAWTLSWARAERDAEIQIVWLPSFGAATDPAGAAAVAEPVEEEVEEDLDEGVEGSEAGLADLLDIVRDRLSASAQPVPTVATPDPVSSDQGLSPEDRDPMTADQAASLRSTALSLERLSAVRPELALSSGMADWPLIRNPSVVVRFIKGRYDRVDRGSRAEGLVSVALWIDETGSVEWAEVHRSSGRSDLDEIALAVFREVASFRPARSQGAPVPLAVVISVPFPF